MGAVPNAEDLAAGIAIEAGELQQLFLWRDGRDADAVLEQRRADVQTELADVLIHCLNFARRAKIDIATVVSEKLAANARKYPTAEVKGRIAAHHREGERTDER